MSTIDIPQLLEGVSPDNPCGDDLDLVGDPAFQQLDLAATAKPERRMGDSVIAGQEPNWSDVRSRALDLLGRTKDLRVATTLSRSLLHTDGIAGLRDGLELVAGLLERYWDGVHPRLDPQDGNDPTMRVNALAALSDWNGVVRPARAIPLVRSRALGRYGLREIEIANGTTPKPSDEETAPEMAVIEQAFIDADMGELKDTAESMRGALEVAGRIGTLVSEKTGGSGVVNMERLTSFLKGANQILDQQLARRGEGSGAGSPPEVDGAGEGQAQARPRAISGEVTSREDVIRLLDKACDYFNRNEPSSPVPLLLQRAKRLVSMNFLEIVQDLAPGGAAEVRSIGGLDSGGG